MAEAKIWAPRFKVVGLRLSSSMSKKRKELTLQKRMSKALLEKYCLGGASAPSKFEQPASNLLGALAPPTAAVELAVSSAGSSAAASSAGGPAVAKPAELSHDLGLGGLGGAASSSSGGQRIVGRDVGGTPAVGSSLGTAGENGSSGGQQETVLPFNGNMAAEKGEEVPPGGETAHPGGIIFVANLDMLTFQPEKLLQLTVQKDLTEAEVNFLYAKKLKRKAKCVDDELDDMKMDSDLDSSEEEGDGGVVVGMLGDDDDDDEHPMLGGEVGSSGEARAFGKGKLDVEMVEANEETNAGASGSAAAGGASGRKNWEGPQCANANNPMESPSPSSYTSL